MMWTPTHVHVTVQKASGLLTKGKRNTNDCFVTIALGKTKYQTSVKEKASSDVEWHEECELAIPDQGNTAELVLTVLHRNALGVDEFLGRVAIPLNSLDIYERPKNKWYILEAKPGKTGKAKERGSLEVKIGFTVKSGSLTDLSKKEKHRSSLSHVAHSVGGSLLSLGSAEKRQGIKKLAQSIGTKMHIRSKKKDKYSDETSSNGSFKKSSLSLHKQTREDADPGVVSDEDDFTFDDLSHKSSMLSLNNTTSSGGNNVVSSMDNINENQSKVLNQTQDEWESKLFGKQTAYSKEDSNRKSWDSTKLSTQVEKVIDTVKSKDDITIKSKSKLTDFGIGGAKNDKLRNFSIKEVKEELKLKTDSPNERIIIGGENEQYSPSNNVSNEILQKFEGKSRQELILCICELQKDLDSKRKKLKDLEDYIDDLLLRVMETTPNILRNPYVTC